MEPNWQTLSYPLQSNKEKYEKLSMLTKVTFRDLNAKTRLVGNGMDIKKALIQLYKAQPSVSNHNFKKEYKYYGNKPSTLGEVFKTTLKTLTGVFRGNFTWKELLCKMVRSCLFELIDSTLHHCTVIIDVCHLVPDQKDKNSFGNVVMRYGYVNLIRHIDMIADFAKRFVLPLFRDVWLTSGKSRTHSEFQKMGNTENVLDNKTSQDIQTIKSKLINISTYMTNHKPEFPTELLPDLPSVMINLCQLLRYRYLLECSSVDGTEVAGHSSIFLEKDNDSVLEYLVDELVITDYMEDNRAQPKVADRRESAESVIAKLGTTARTADKRPKHIQSKIPRYKMDTTMLQHILWTTVHRSFSTLDNNRQIQAKGEKLTFPWPFALLSNDSVDRLLLRHPLYVKIQKTLHGTTEMWDFYHMLLLYNMGQEDVLVLPGLTYAKLLHPNGGAMFPPENKLFSPPDNFFSTNLVFLLVGYENHYSLVVFCNLGAVGKNNSPEKVHPSSFVGMLYIDTYYDEVRQKGWLYNFLNGCHRVKYPTALEFFNETNFPLFQPKVPKQKDLWSCLFNCMQYSGAMLTLALRDSKFPNQADTTSGFSSYMDESLASIDINRTTALAGARILRYDLGLLAIILHDPDNADKDTHQYALDRYIEMNKRKNWYLKSRGKPTLAFHQISLAKPPPQSPPSPGGVEITKTIKRSVGKIIKADEDDDDSDCVSVAAPIKKPTLPKTLRNFSDSDEDDDETTDDDDTPLAKLAMYSVATEISVETKTATSKNDDDDDDTPIAKDGDQDDETTDADTPLAKKEKYSVATAISDKTYKATIRNDDDDDDTPIAKDGSLTQGTDDTKDRQGSPTEMNAINKGADKVETEEDADLTRGDDSHDLKTHDQKEMAFAEIKALQVGGNNTVQNKIPGDGKLELGMKAKPSQNDNAEKDDVRNSESMSAPDSTNDMRSLEGQELGTLDGQVNCVLDDNESLSGCVDDEMSELGLGNSKIDLTTPISSLGGLYVSSTAKPVTQILQNEIKNGPTGTISVERYIQEAVDRRVSEQVAREVQLQLSKKKRKDTAPTLAKKKPKSSTSLPKKVTILDLPENSVFLGCPFCDNHVTAMADSPDFIFLAKEFPGGRRQIDHNNNQKQGTLMGLRCLPPFTQHRLSVKRCPDRNNRDIPPLFADRRYKEQKKATSKNKERPTMVPKKVLVETLYRCFEHAEIRKIMNWDEPGEFPLDVPSKGTGNEREM